VAQIGPGISLDSFEVGDEVYETFQHEGFQMSTISRKDEKWHIDLPACNRLQLLDVGVESASIHHADICTYKHCEDYFSARRLGIQSGRIFTGILCSK
jgi:copper oxidase (laccase) domain-containing protein